MSYVEPTPRVEPEPTESYLSASDLEHCDFEDAFEADRPSNDHRFLAFPCQDQHC
jgi:hypothetical protein